MAKDRIPPERTFELKSNWAFVIARLRDAEGRRGNLGAEEPQSGRTCFAGPAPRFYAGLDVVGPLYATKTEFGRRLRHIVASKGVPAAVRWLAAEFCE
jgi:hypothetical protein